MDKRVRLFGKEAEEMARLAEASGSVETAARALGLSVIATRHGPALPLPGESGICLYLNDGEARVSVMADARSITGRRFESWIDEIIRYTCALAVSDRNLVFWTLDWREDGESYGGTETGVYVWCAACVAETGALRILFKMGRYRLAFVTPENLLAIAGLPADLANRRIGLKRRRAAQSEILTWLDMQEDTPVPEGLLDELPPPASFLYWSFPKK